LKNLIRTRLTNVGVVHVQDIMQFTVEKE
jgi:hypothetical protein